YTGKSAVLAGSGGTFETIEEQSFADDIERIGLVLCTTEGERDIVASCDPEFDDRQTKLARHRFQICHLRYRLRVAGIGQDRKTSHGRNHYPQYLQRLVGALVGLVGESCDVAARPREARHKTATDRVTRNRKNDGSSRCGLPERRHGASGGDK